MTRLLILLAFLATPAVAAAQPFTIEGPVSHVRDADTIKVADPNLASPMPVRLQGINSPEDGEVGYKGGQDWMRSYVLGKEVRCAMTGETNGDRYIGVCYLEGEDIGGAAVAAGWARDCPRFSKGRYRHLETDYARQTFKVARFC